METLQRTANRGSLSTGYEIDNSCKFEASNDEAIVTTNQASGNQRTMTFSVWIKRTNAITSVAEYIFGAGETVMRFNTSEALQLYTTSSTYLETTQVFRDTAAWYHLVWIMDTTDSTEADRNRNYVNGSRVTSFSNASYPTQNTDLNLGGQGTSSNWLQLGRWYAGGREFNGYMAEVHYLNGTVAEPSNFGETDSDSCIWIPKEYTGGNYGTQGFYYKFDDSSNMGKDSSGEGHDANSLANITAADQSTDTPTNNFTTWNTIRRYNQGTTLIKDGGTVVENNFSGGFSSVNNNIRLGKGKWYAEFEVLESGNYLMNGNVDADYIDESLNGDFYLGSLSNKKAGAGYYSSGTTGNDAIYYEGTYTSSGVTTSAGDVISVAMDCDNNKVHFAVNGSWTNSSDPANNTNGFAMTDAEQYFALASIGDKDFKSNFGGYTADTISSAATDANGYGTFEYAPPSGFYSCCTKNLAEYG